VIGLRIGDGGAQPGFDAIDRQRLHDDASREGEDLLGCNTEQSRRIDACALRVRETALTGPGIRVPGVYNERADVRGMAKMPASDQHGRGTEPILREHARRSRPWRKRHQQKIGAVGLADAGSSDAERNASDRIELISRRSREIDCHER
jgi:hypothetical protein